MSLGYAEKLSYRDDLGGQLGAKELFDDAKTFLQKVDELTELVRKSEKIVVYTGAGISTSCGIPDFRGPNGIWTLQRAGKPLPKPRQSFAAAKPSLTHQALLGLWHSSKISLIVSQNVDGLHLRSGFPASHLAELHGNCFLEICSRCRHRHVRDFEIETVGFKATGRRCGLAGCRGALRDCVLDWEDELPEAELKRAEREASQADLSLCLGTSLQISPACNIPLRTLKREGGKLAIVNLQATPRRFEKQALVIRGLVDDVMSRLMSGLGLPIPSYVRTDAVSIAVDAAMTKRKATPGTADGCRVTLTVAGRDGDASYPQPMLESVHVTFREPPGLEPQVLSRAPFQVQRHLAVPCRLAVELQLHLSSAADEGRRHVQLEEHFELPRAGHKLADAVRLRSFDTQVVAYGDQKSAEIEVAHGGAGEQPTLTLQKQQPGQVQRSLRKQEH